MPDRDPNGTWPAALSRRRFLTQLAAGGAALGLLAACGGGVTTSSQGGSSATSTNVASSGAPSSAATSSASSAASGSAGSASGNVVNIAALYPSSGEFALPNVAIVNAAKLAVDMVNEAGGIKSMGGAKLNLILADLRSDATVTRTETERVLTSNKVAAAHGSYASALTLIATEVSERLKVPFLTGSIADKILERGFKYVFAVSARGSAFGSSQVQIAKSMVEGPAKVAVVWENTAYGTATSKGIQDEAKKQGLDVVLFEPYSPGLTDAGPLVNKIKGSGAPIVFPIAYPNDTVLIIRAMKQQGVKAVLIGGGGGFVVPDFVKNFGADAEGVVSVEAWNWDINDDAKKVNELYKKRFNDLFLHEYAGEVVAQTFIIAEALERAGTADPEKVRDEIAKTDASKGYAAMMPGNKVKFDQTGKNVYAHVVGAQWQKGEFVTVFPKEDAKAPIVKPA